MKAHPNTRPATLWDKLLTAYQYLLPQHLISRLTFHLTRVRSRAVKNLLIRTFIRVFEVDMSIAEHAEAGAYVDFNAFFTRALKNSARPQPTDSNAIACPVDGTVSQSGVIEGDRLLQAKGHDYSLEALLAGDPIEEKFIDGRFITIYLSPRDYHRIHMPVSGRLNRMIYVPGKLFRVSDRTTRVIPGLFARNERVINLFDTDVGPVAVILVGAINVGCMETAWHGVVKSPQERRLQIWGYDDKEITLQRGDELGRFNMGSTVILLFPPGSAELDGKLATGQHVCVGQDIGTLLKE
jgi:phosphatidylserine decarboxylase